MTQLLPPKKEVALALLERSNVDVYLDPRADGVVVPPQFRKEPRLILKIGLNMPVPIPDLRLDDESMSCTLSFNRAKFFCVVPWLSVFAMVGDDGRGMVWPDDVPQELAIRAEERRPSVPSDESALVPAPAPSRGKAKSRLLSDSPRDSERGATPRSKRPRTGKAEPKKKEEAARPALHAVPSPAPSEPRPSEPRPSEPRNGGVEKLADRREEQRPERAPLTPRVDRPTQTTPRPKRELPPYLRVVK